MRLCVVLALVLAAAPARADTGGVVELGSSIGSFRLHDTTMMGAGLDLAAGVHVGKLALMGDLEHVYLIPPIYSDSATANRIGWRLRYDLELDDQPVRDSNASFRQAVVFDAGTGEQFVQWDGVDRRRSDLALGAGWILSAHDGPDHHLLWGLFLGLRATFAPAVDFDTIARTLSPPPAPGQERSYMFVFGLRV